MSENYGIFDSLCDRMNSKVNLQKHILIIVENLPVPFDRRVWMEASTLSQAGYKVSVISPRNKNFSAEYEVLNNIEIYRHSLFESSGTLLSYLIEYPMALVSEFILTCKIYRKQKIDLIQICNPPDFIFLVVFWFKLFFKTRIIFDHHDLVPEMFESNYKKRGTFYFLARIAEFLTFKVSDAVITTNLSYRNTAITRGRKSPESVFIVRSSPDLNIFRPIPNQKKFSDKGNYKIGYLGVMGIHDGVELLMQIIHELVVKRKQKNVYFTVIGSGPKFPEIIYLAEKLDIKRYIHFKGRVSDQRVINLLGECDICVDCSPINYFNNVSTMNKVLEYMALGKPVVQFNLKEGKRSAAMASLYAKSISDFADKIEFLLKHPRKRKAMGIYARMKMEEELGWHKQSLILLTAYKKALSDS